MSQFFLQGKGGGGGGTTFVPLTTFQPNNVLSEFDDFIGSFSGAGSQSKLNWNFVKTGGSQGQIPGTDNNPGQWFYTSQGFSGQNWAMLLNQATSGGSPVIDGPFALGGGLFSISWIVDLTALSNGTNTYTFYAGLGDGTTLNSLTASFVNGLYFSYTNGVNGGNWVINSTNSSTTRSVYTAAAASTGFHTLSITVNSAGTSASFYVDNVMIGTAITTHIPSASITPFLMALNSAGVTPDIYIDLFYVYYELSIVRKGPTFSESVVGTGMLIEQYTATAISYQVLNSDAIIGVTSTSAPRTITMPNSGLVKGQVWTIKDESGGAAANNITVSGNGANIDGSATFVINNNYGSISLYWNGLQFFII